MPTGILWPSRRATIRTNDTDLARSKRESARQTRTAFKAKPSPLSSRGPRRKVRNDRSSESGRFDQPENRQTVVPRLVSRRKATAAQRPLLASGGCEGRSTLC